jgi:hypothetical protein
MDDIRALLILHATRYPLMETNDVIKLIYQSTLGPAHFSKTPTKEHILMGINNELQMMEKSVMPLDEPLTDGLTRISLQSINQGIIDLDTLATAFYESMRNVLVTKAHVISFRARLNMFLDLVRNQEITLDLIKVEQEISEYLEQGIRPVSHSNIFKEAYHPHYRVILKHLI